MLSCDYLFKNHIFSYQYFLQDYDRASNEITYACDLFILDIHNSNFYQHHPNLHGFVKILKGVQTETYIKIRSTYI